MAAIVQIVWDDEPGGNVEHVAEHGVTPEEVDAVIRAKIEQREPSESNPDTWVVDGFTPARRRLRVVFLYLEELSIVIPVTAFEANKES